jgi:hypothetical protein
MGDYGCGGRYYNGKSCIYNAAMDWFKAELKNLN